jgi:glycosyltransferase involved in cell wall biosynthesis
VSIEERRIRALRLSARSLYGLGRLRQPARGRGGAVRSVLYVSPLLFGPDGIVGGGERAAYELARAVAHEVPTTLVSFGASRSSQRKGPLRIEIYPSAGDLVGQRFDPLSYRFLEQLRGVDVVHCNQYRVAVSQLAILAGAALGKRTFATDRGGVGVHFDPQLPVERRLTALLPISRFSLQQLPSDAPARVIFGGATDHFLSGGANRPTGAQTSQRRVLYVGRIMRHKGIDVLIEGLPDGVGLDVVGHVYDEEFHALLQRLASGRDVRFVHDASDADLLDAYSGALVTVLPSVYRDAFGGEWQMPELLGNVLLESMACATPVICSDVGGMPEAVEDGLVGFVVPPSDPEALRRRIGELAGDAALRDEMGRRARGRVLERFTWPAVARCALDAYREC